MTGQRVFKAKQAAEAYGVSVETLMRAVKTGALRGKRSGGNGGGHYLFSAAALDEWFEGLIDA